MAECAGPDAERIRGDRAMLGAFVAGKQNGDMTMRNAIFASIGVALMLALAPPPAVAQSNPPPGAASAAAIPRTGAGAGSSAARTRHRNTLNRQRARRPQNMRATCASPHISRPPASSASSPEPRRHSVGRPGDDVSLRNHGLKEMDRRLGGRRLIEEFDHQREIDVEPQHVVRVNLAIGAKPATPLKTVTLSRRAGRAKPRGSPASSLCAVP